jgi:F-type H+-transporting ATPase subunit epsilon
MAQDNILLEIVAPEGEVFKGEVDSVSVPTYQGTITVLPHHVPLFTRLSEGEVEIRNSGKTTTIIIAGGFCEIKQNSVHILSDYAVRAESIEIAKSLEKKRTAEQKLSAKLSNEDFTMADKDLRLSILELKVADKMKKRRTNI